MAGRKKKGISADWSELIPQPGEPSSRRKTPYDPPVADYIIEQIEVYGRSLLSICDDPEAVSRAIFFRWMEDHPELRVRYARAREALADHAADEIAEIARTVTPESAVADRVKLDALKWRAERLKPRSYSPTARVENTGAGGGPIQLEAVKTIDAAALDPDAREALKQALLAAKG